MLTLARPVRRSLADSPEEVAASLRHLPGFLWFDTAGSCPEPDRDHAFSLLTACPAEIRRGQRHELAGLASEIPPHGETIADWGLPVAGWFGGIDYDGAWQFGRYPHLLAYRHATGEWFETGNLLGLRQHRPDPATPPPLAWQGDTTAQEFMAMVAAARAYIAAGDIYQVNLAHRFRAAWPERADPFALYLRLRQLCPAPYAAYLDLGHRKVLSASPESFLRMSGSSIRTRPIKGTRPRSSDPVADERARLELLTSPKERAELIMITDLLRNDLGMVSEFGSVGVSGLLEPESYANVHHLVSTIRGTLRPEISHATAVQTCIPGGSITGAPKKRATEIIRELERVPRGLYTGAIGYLGSNGESQFSIAIRTLILENGELSCHAGAGIVADSDPAAEWQETLHKVAALLAAAS
jgi:aminodeoxychorismate synthase component I